MKFYKYEGCGNDFIIVPENVNSSTFRIDYSILCTVMQESVCRITASR